jgi:hypothetical protein
MCVVVLCCVVLWNDYVVGKWKNHENRQPLRVNPNRTRPEGRLDFSGMTAHGK